MNRVDVGGSLGIMKQMLGVLGGGQMDLALAVGFAERGYPVKLVEPSSDRFQALTEGSFCSSEKELVAAFEKVRNLGLLEITQSFETLGSAGFIFVCAEEGQLWPMMEQACDGIADDGCIIIKGTVSVGTGDQLQDWFDRKGKRVLVMSSPAFLQRGRVLEDLRHPSRVILGGDAYHPRLIELRHLLADLGQFPIVVTKRKEAEMIGLASNAFLATKTSFINQIAQLCDALDTDIRTIARGIGMDPSIGQAFLVPGIGFEGPSLSKDLLSLIEQGNERGVETPLLEAVRTVNDAQKDWMRNQLVSQLGSLEGKTLAIWGVSLKGGVQEMIYSPAVYVLEQLLAEGAIVHIHDPYDLNKLRKLWESRETIEKAKGRAHWCEDKWEAIEGADALVILTDWQEYQEIDLFRLKDSLKKPFIFDGRTLFHSDMMKEMGFRYISVGRKV